MEIVRKLSVTNKEAHAKCINEVIARVEEIGEDAVGLIVAQDIINIVTDNLGPEIYNRAIHDAKKLLEDRASDMQTELDLLQVQA